MDSREMDRRLVMGRRGTAHHGDRPRWAGAGLRGARTCRLPAAGHRRTIARRGRRRRL